MDAWTRSSSPTTSSSSSSSSSVPATPQSFLDSPCCLQSPHDHFRGTTTGDAYPASGFTFDSFDLSKSFDMYRPSPAHSSPCSPASSCSEGNACGLASYHAHADFAAALLPKDAYAPFHPDMATNGGHLGMGMGMGVGLDFSSLVASLTPYTI
jgi:hypothetical protein